MKARQAASHSLALKSDGTVVAWGDNSSGQLGDGTTTNHTTPVAVPGLTGVVAIAAYSHSLALKSDGTVVAWGGNYSGQLGDGTTSSRYNPLAVPGLTGVVAVAAAGHSLVLKSDGTVVAWGSNYAGQLGDGTTTQRTSPVAVTGGLNLGSTSARSISLNPTSLTFAGQIAGISSAAQTLTLTNSSANPVSIAVAVSSNFTKATTCTATLASGASCTISVTFTPTAVGNITGGIGITGSAGLIAVAGLSGVGTGPAGSLSWTSLSFPAQSVGTTSYAQGVTLTNVGTSPMAITGIGVTGDFAMTNNCGSGLGAGSYCSISFTFSPTATGTRTGTLTVTTDAYNSPHTVDLTGTGQGSIVGLNPSSLAFGNQLVNTTSPVHTATLTNTGNQSITITSVAASGNFAVTHNCGSGLTASGSCSLNATFTPSATGARTGTITVISSSPISPHLVTLSGTGVTAIAPVCTLTASPTSVIKNGAAVLTSNCTNSPTSYSWTGGTCAGTTSATCTVNPAATTTYGVTGTNSAGTGASSAIVTVRAIDLTPILMLLLD